MQQLQQATAFLQSKGIRNPQVGIVLGTGLHKLLDYVRDAITISYSDIPHFPVSTMEFHKGNLVYGKIGGITVLIMQGRLHYYEGYTMEEIVFPVRVMKLLGVRQLLMTNAGGGINLSLKKGDLVLIKDHINQQSSNPLTGQNKEALGPRFPDMSKPYSAALNEALQKKAAALNITLKSGVYVSVNGPMLETPAEYRFLKIIGADVVGMSTVPEVIAASHMQLPCAAVSVITDECDPDNLKPISIAEIIEVATKADGVLANLLYQTIQTIV